MISQVFLAYKNSNFVNDELSGGGHAVRLSDWLDLLLFSILYAIRLYIH